MKTLRWDQIPFNPWLQGLKPGMLSDECYITKDVTKANVGMVRIHFDRSFVLAFMVKFVLKPLMIVDIKEWNRLTGEAWRIYRYGESEDSSKPVLVASTHRKTVKKQAQ